MPKPLSLLENTRIVDLTQPWCAGMPHWPTHPPYACVRTKKMGDFVFGDGLSSSAEMVVLGTHVGTHIDGFGHFSQHGRLHNGMTPDEAGIDRVAPIVRRALFYDAVPGGLLKEDDAITQAQLETGLARTPQSGDVVLVRTGWGRLWHDAKAYLNNQRQPGLSVEALRWLSGRGVFAIGSDNVALERIPSPGMPGHVHLLVERGVHIIECLNLEELAAVDRPEFIFVGAPLKLAGATGAPLRAFAIVEK